jgi:hypothetical protein
MKRVLAVLALGAIGGIGAHFGYFQVHRPCTDPTLACELAWIRDELDLTQAQYATLQDLHQISEPRLEALADQMAMMRQQFLEFEAQRRGAGEIDFIEFSLFIQDRSLVEEECETSTRDLILASAELMEPDQRERYLSMIDLSIDFPLTQSL